MERSGGAQKERSGGKAKREDRRGEREGWRERVLVGSLLLSSLSLPFVVLLRVLTDSSVGPLW